MFFILQIVYIVSIFDNFGNVLNEETIKIEFDKHQSWVYVFIQTCFLENFQPYTWPWYFIGN